MSNHNDMRLSGGRRALFYVLCPLSLLCLLGALAFYLTAPGRSAKRDNMAALTPNGSGKPTVNVGAKEKAAGTDGAGGGGAQREVAQKRLGDHPLAKSVLMRKWLRADPAFAEVRKRDLRRRTLNAYGDLFANLKLAPEKIEALKSLLDRHSDQQDELRSVLAEQGVGANDPLHAKAFSDAFSEKEREVREFLSAENVDYSIYERVNQSLDWKVSYSGEFDCYLSLQGEQKLDDSTALLLRNTVADVRIAARTQGDGQDLMASHRKVNEEVVRRMSATLGNGQSKALAQYLEMVLQRNEAVRKSTRPGASPGSVVYSDWSN